MFQTICYRAINPFLSGYKMICTLYYGCFSLHLDSLLCTCCLLTLYPFECVILQVIVSLRASLKQLIISVIVTIHQNSHVLNWSQIITSTEILLESCNSLSSTCSKKFTHRLLNISCSWRQHGELFFLFGKFKACIKTYLDFTL